MKETQKALVEMYARYVSAPKAEFFRRAGLDMIQSGREGTTIELVADGRPPLELVDCRTSGGVYNLGHRHPEIVAALREGVGMGLDIGDHHLLSEHRALLAKKLAELLPGDISKTQFCATGGEAVDLAIKLARGHTQRRRVVSAAVGYHGVTGMSLAAGAPKFRDVFLWDLDDFVHVPFGDISVMEEVLTEDVAAVILETIPATGGILIAPDGYFGRVRELCDERGIIMISDEVQTGLGRTGALWGIHGGLYENERVVPDIMVLAKGMSAGVYPMATCSYRPGLERVFEQDPFLHISTTGGSELGCHVTSRMLDIVSGDDFLANVRSCGDLLGEGLQKFREAYPFVADVRGRGLMWGIEFTDPRLGLAFTVKMVQHGIFADYCGNMEQTVKLMPPLVVTPHDVATILGRLGRALQALASDLG